MDLVKDLCLTPDLFASEVVFMDTNGERLDSVHAIAAAYARAVGAKIHFRKTMKRSEALKDADFVIDTALAGGHYEQETVRRAGEKHGYYRGVEAVEFNMVSDYYTTFGAYHQLSLFLDLAIDMEDLCPNAWLIDVANPECEAGTLLTRKSKVKVVGYCHGYKHYKDICRILGLDTDRVDFQVAGFNHNIWLTRFLYRGRDAYPLLDEWIEKKAEEHWNTYTPTDEFDTQMSRASADMYRLYGLFPVGDTTRSGSWKYHYDLRTKQYWYGPFGGPDSEIGFSRYLKRMEKNANTVLALAGAPASSLLVEIPPVKSTEDVVPLIDSIVNDKGGRFVLDFRNEGLIAGLPDDVAVEAPVSAGRKGIQRERIGQIPDELLKLALIPRLVRLEFAMEAFLGGGRSVLLELLSRDPRTRSNEQAKRVLDEILNLPFNKDVKKHYS
jgi:alpha-galactosidase